MARTHPPATASIMKLAATNRTQNTANFMIDRAWERQPAQPTLRRSRRAGRGGARRGGAPRGAAVIKEFASPREPFPYPNSLITASGWGGEGGEVAGGGWWVVGARPGAARA
ncbi:hypothetical protein A8711_15175 [Micromonospora sp. II]|nr:hypothetical protein A8711_15175 [Micromonospora sp. II]